MEHPITPPDVLVDHWLAHAPNPLERVTHIATQAARWGADQELEACCAWLEDTDCDNPQEVAQLLRAAMRPKPPSLKKQACDALDTYVYGNPNSQDKERTYNTIRRALERLAELENHEH